MLSTHRELGQVFNLESIQSSRPHSTLTALIC